LAFSLRVDAAPAEIAFGAVIAQSLQRYWQIHGRLREGYEWYLRAINHAKDLAPEMYIYMHNLAGSFAAMQGDLMAARGHHEAALQSAHPLGNGKLEATTLHFLGLTIARSGDLAQSHRLLTECLKIYRRTPEITSADLSSLLNNLAVVSTRLGDYAQSIVLLSEGLELCRARGDKLSMGHVLSSLGDLALRQGDLVASARYHQESLLVRQELNNRLGMLASVEHVASLAVAQKRFSEAARLYAAAEALQAEYHTQLTGHQLDEHRENVARLRSMVEPNDLERSWRMGAGMSLDEAVRLASAVTSS
jgi:tetratricopeptide (TPR) repeat protein